MDFAIEVVKFLTALVGFAAAVAGFASTARDGDRGDKKKGR